MGVAILCEHMCAKIGLMFLVLVDPLTAPVVSPGHYPKFVMSSYAELMILSLSILHQCLGMLTESRPGRTVASFIPIVM